MKHSKLLIGFILTFYSIPSFSQTNISKYDLCEISGYFSGRGENFMFGLATYHNRLHSPDFFSGSQCMSLFSAGYEVGLKTSEGKLNYSETENQIRNKAADFSEFIYKSILENAELHVVD